MDSYLISFHLNNSDDYNQVSERIRRYPKWARVMNNVWIVKCDSKLTDVRESISSIINENGGSVLVIKVNNDAWGTYAVDKEVTDFMKVFNNIGGTCGDLRLWPHFLLYLLCRRCTG